MAIQFNFKHCGSSELLIDESLIGWKEYEMEVVRDTADNAIIVCSIENVDPMGVHTGDSITVAPALTLTDKEYQIMRNHSIAVLREIGVETGGSNVQWAINPEDGRMVVIEMNPRVSRSSALASKATGFPIAKIAAKLAIGYTLDELDNDITRVTPASFEPTIDYVVTKIPRFAFEKFSQASPKLTTQMKSVGEVMGIGRSFQEALQKACQSLEINRDGKKYAIEFKDGDAKAPLKVIGKSKETGTQITFLPSKDIFSSIKFSANILIKRMRELAFLNKGITEPLDPITFPYRTTENLICFSPFILFAAIKSLSEVNFVAPYKLIGAHALSVESATTLFTLL